MAPQDPANDNGIFLFVVPRQPSWLFEVDGEVFFELTAAEAFSRTIGKPIYCRTRKANAR